MVTDNKKIKSFTDLYAWQEAHKLVLMVYAETEKFPKREIFGLTVQIRRSVVSITSNIAEGFNRNASKDKCQFYSMAHGSLTELRNQLLATRDVGYLSQAIFNKLADQTVVVAKLINCLRKIRNK